MIMAKKSGVSGALRRFVFKRDGFCCKQCGVKGWEEKRPKGGYGYPTAKTGIYLSIDHIHPKSKGGSHDVFNLRTLCTTCNTKKGACIT